MTRLQRQGMRYLVLDLRGNPGGLLNVAVDIADRFVDQGVIVSTRGRAPGQTQVFRAKPDKPYTLPVAVLVDRDSASASEILAGALQELGRAVVIGDRSFGKGSVQSIFELRSVPAGLKLTTAKFYSPKNRPYSEQGVTPDVKATVVAKPVVNATVSSTTTQGVRRPRHRRRARHRRPPRPRPARRQPPLMEPVDHPARSFRLPSLHALGPSLIWNHEHDQRPPRLPDRPADRLGGDDRRPAQGDGAGPRGRGRFRLGRGGPALPDQRPGRVPVGRPGARADRGGDDQRRRVARRPARRRGPALGHGRRLHAPPRARRASPTRSRSPSTRTGGTSRSGRSSTSSSSTRPRQARRPGRDQAAAVEPPVRPEPAVPGRDRGVRVDRRDRAVRQRGDRPPRRRDGLVRGPDVGRRAAGDAPATGR